jgi:hypothetical protein
VPDVSQLNAVVVLVHLNGQNLYFDPATRFCPYGLIPWFEDDAQGIQWDKAPQMNGNIVRVQTRTAEIALTQRTAKLKLQPDGSLEGTMEIVFTGQEALDRRLSAYDEDDAGRRKLMEDEIKELVPAGATVDIDEVTGWQASEQPLRVKCHLHAERFAVKTPKRMLFRLSVFQTNSKHPFPQVYRTQPVYFGHGYQTSDAIDVSLPSGYKLEALPPDSDGVTDFAEFHAKRTSESGIVRLDRQTEMKGYFFPVKSYLPLRAYFQRLRQNDAQTVVLIREDAEHAQ